jgi:hypothetical protein
MSITTKETRITRKSPLITAVCAGAITLIASLSANAAFVITGGSTQDFPVPGNDFDSNLNGQGFNQMTTGAKLSVNQDGFVDFYYIAAESGFANTFHNTNGFITEGDDPFNFNGYAMITVEVSAGDVLDFSFQSASAVALTPVDNLAGTNLEGLGIMTSSSRSSSLTQLVLAYNDNLLGTGDADFDDMLVRADFRVAAVPVPAAVWLFCSGLLGLTGMACRRKQ